MSETLETVLSGSGRFFRGLRPDEIGEVASKFEVHALAKGAAFDIALDAPRMVVVIDGVADIAVDAGGVTMRPRLDAGDRWGEVPLLTHRPRAAKIVARYTSKIALLDREGLEFLLER